LPRSLAPALVRRPDGRVMVGMLMVRHGDPSGELRSILLGGLVAGQHGKGAEPAQAAFDAVLVLRRDFLRLVERAARNRDGWPLDVAERQRRAAVATEAALRLVGAVESRERPASQREGTGRHAGQRREERAERLLAHAAMTDMRAARGLAQRIAHCTALA